MDKAMMDMATRSWSPAVKHLLVDLLNENNYEVEEAQTSQAGRALMKRIVHAEASEDELLAGPVRDDEDKETNTHIRNELDVDSAESSLGLRRSSRALKKPKTIYEDPDFTEGLERGTDYEESEEMESPQESDSEYSDNGADQFEDTEAEENFDAFENTIEHEWYKDEQGETRLLSRSTKQIRETYGKMSKKEQEGYDQDEIVLQQLLTLDPKKVYVEEDLQDPDIHARALRLLHRARFGQANEYSRISPHIRYDRLHKDVVRQININMQASEDQIKYLRSLAIEGKASKALQHARPGVGSAKKRVRDEQGGIGGKEKGLAGKTTKSKPAKPITAGDTTSTKPTSNPSEVTDASPNHTKETPPVEPEEQTDFESYYLKQVTTEFADDLDKLRNASDFREDSLPILINALKGIARGYGEEEKAKVMGKP
ncbi:MAG: hypothetical protein Q9170_000984 [Blastenia crenularia]